VYTLPTLPLPTLPLPSQQFVDIMDAQTHTTKEKIEAARTTLLAISVTSALLTFLKGSAAALLPRFFGQKLVARKNKSNAQTRRGASYPPMCLDSGSEILRFRSPQRCLRSLRDPRLPCCLGFLVKNSSHGKIKVMRRRAAVLAMRPCAWIPDLRRCDFGHLSAAYVP
jgi:hypothetical protein